MQQQCPTLAAMVAGFRREWPETRVAWGPRWHATGTLPACCCVACHRVARGLTHGIPAGMLAYVCGHPAPAAPLACCCGNAVCVFDRIKTWRTCFPPSQAMVSQVRRSHRDILPVRWVAALWHFSSGILAMTFCLRAAATGGALSLFNSLSTVILCWLVLEPAQSRIPPRPCLQSRCPKLCSLAPRPACGCC